ncbi:PAS domain-containing sensor histidine kinase [Pedobacter aquatilis]|uniref:PAS domain-containing sensor histidine kinase n=1 Tax=Pedobacter aquatilis TaxID=351343 RepID=UPI0025B2EA09|nr:PAS domain-containing sensor histidine kinase [Pedobacter aquatilis]MDN3588380.1 PAS domain-containing sensor histidine kinase [Pedobacter aquatilis]
MHNDIFCQIGDTSRDIYFIFNYQTKEFDYVGQAFEPIFGIETNLVKVAPLKLLDFIHPEDKNLVLEFYRECSEEAVNRKYEFRIIDAEETIKYLRVSTYPIKHDGKLSLIAGIAEDVSVAKHNNFHIEKINARKNTTLEIVSHDLKEPMAMISLAVSDLLKDKLFEGQERILASLTFIKDMCERNILLIRNLINHEFLSSSEIEIRKERTDIVHEIKEVIGFYKMSEANLFRNFHFTSYEEKIYAFTDSMKLMQVINNLISNSIKFTKVNGSISINIEDRGERIIISVSDDGIGIPKHLQPYIFDRFSIAMRDGLKGEDSWGLGMAIAKVIVNLHNGRIWLESVENVGSKFFIEIPK